LEFRELDYGLASMELLRDVAGDIIGIGIALLMHVGGDSLPYVLLSGVPLRPGEPDGVGSFAGHGVLEERPKVPIFMKGPRLPAVVEEAAPDISSLAEKGFVIRSDVGGAGA